MLNFKVDRKRFAIWKENVIFLLLIFFVLYILYIIIFIIDFHINFYEFQYSRSLKNYKAEQPYQHAVYYLAVLLSEQIWMKDELLNALSCKFVKHLAILVNKQIHK